MSETLYGRNPVYECLRAGRRGMSEVILARGARERGTLAEIVALAGRRGVPVRRVDRRQLDRSGGGINHQGILASVSAYPYAEWQDLLVEATERKEPPWLLLLDCLQDPQNLGTLLRTAEILGVHGVILPERRAVGVTPAVVSASSGASEHLPIAQVTNLARTIRDLQERDVWVYGLEDVQEASLLWETDLGGALALVVGSEGQGMRRLVRESCDVLVRLPTRGQIHSLNASVAGSVALYEVARQRWQ
jgi:23S rRNA (guanosine2251-2'-O)-methyltransferase